MLSNLGTSLFLAYKSILRGNRAVLILTPLVVGFSIANLVFFASLFSGVIHGLEKQLVDNLFSNILIEPQDDHDVIQNADAFVGGISRLSGVIAAAPHYKVTARFTFDPDKNNQNVTRRSYQIIGIDPIIEPTVTKIKNSLIRGRYLESSDRDSILIGAEVAGGGLGTFHKISLGGVRVGDKIRATYSNGRVREYTVQGIFKSGLDAIDALTFVTRKEMESVLDLNNSAHEVLVRLEKIGNEDAVVNEIRGLGYEKENISPWDTLSNFTAAMSNSFKILNFVTGLVSLMVAGITIFIVIFIHIVNKRKQLGILKAIGVSESIIINSYLLQTLFYSLIGSALAVGIIYGIADPYFDSHPLNMGFALVNLIVEPYKVVESSLVITATSLVAGFIPSWTSVRQSIIKSIWG